MKDQTEQDSSPLASFGWAFYRRHNLARLDHLATLRLDLRGRVLELGSGPGDHTPFYLLRGCRVVSTDARQESLAELKRRYPMVETVQADLNDPDALKGLGTFDVVHCYGILYHLESPEALIAAIAEVCSGLLVLETCVSPGPGSAINHIEEPADNFTQSATGRGCRPTRTWVFDTLKKYFPFVYQTRTQPSHPEFPTDWTAVFPDGGLQRIVLVASVRPLDNPVLSPELLEVQEKVWSRAG